MNWLLNDFGPRLRFALHNPLYAESSLHDSLHTYEQMLWVYRVAYPFIKQGGLLISDDAAWNPAFPEFCVEARATRFRILRGVGFLQKNSS